MVQIDLKMFKYLAGIHKVENVYQNIQMPVQFSYDIWVGDHSANELVLTI